MTVLNKYTGVRGFNALNLPVSVSKGFQDLLVLWLILSLCIHVVLKIKRRNCCTNGLRKTRSMYDGKL